MKEKILVRAIKTHGWYQAGEVYEVNNYICFNWEQGQPFFEKGKGVYGIPVDECEILSKDECIPEYSMEELIEKIGHKFKIKPA